MPSSTPSRISGGIIVGALSTILGIGIGSYVAIYVGNVQYRGSVDISGNVTASGALNIDATGAVIRVNGDARLVFLQGSLTGTGGKRNYRACTIPYPWDKLTNSGASVRRASVAVRGLGVANSKIDCGPATAAATNSGSSFLFTQRNIVGSGAVVWAISGSGSGPGLVLSKGQSWVCVFQKATTASGECRIELEDTEDTR